MMLTFSSRISPISPMALSSITHGFFEWTGISTSSPPPSASRPAIRPPREATSARPPAFFTARATSTVVCSAPPVSSSGVTCSRVKFSGRVGTAPV